MAIPSTQTSVQIQQSGYWLDGVRVAEDAPVPSPGAGEVLVHLQLRPINPGDLFCLIGIYPGFIPASYPAVPGMEGMGVVASLGPDVTQFSVGQRVTSTLWPGFRTGNGTWQQYIVVPAEALEPVPDDVTDVQAACAVINPASVLGLLEVVGPVPEGAYLIVNAAGSAMGRQMLAVCKERGILTIAIARRSDLIQELLAEGAAVVLVHTEEDIGHRVAEITGGAGAWAALDCLAGTTTSILCQAVRLGGTVVVYGAMESPTFTLSVAETLFRNVSVRGYWNQLEMATMTAAQRSQRLAEVWDLFQRGIISTGASATVPLTETLDALQAHMDPDRPGKILLSS